MAGDGKLSVLRAPDQAAEAEETREETREERTLPLRDGHTLAVVPGGDDPGQTIELRAASGELELRIRMTEDGPVLCVDGLRLAIDASQEVALRCKAFEVDAAESVAIKSRGSAELSSEQGLDVRSEGDVRVRGAMIYLN